MQIENYKMVAIFFTYLKMPLILFNRPIGTINVDTDSVLIGTI